MAPSTMHSVERPAQLSPTGDRDGPTKSLTESMRAMERKMSAMRHAPAAAAGRTAVGPGAPTIANIAR